MQGIKEKLGFHATALSLRSRRNEILASNIANAATPNFKARDLDFDTELKKANKIGFISTSNEKHFSNVQRRVGKDTLYRDPLNPSLDGNTVELAVEQMEFSENVMRYQTTLSFLTSKIKGIRSAIKGESS
jgi:flagellar basal-body rod protein FlgB